MAKRSLYDVLGLSPSASADELKKAYRRLARENHPDVNPGDAAAEERFKQLSHAFAVLSDPAKRAMYDELGDDAEQLGYDPEKLEAFRRYKAAQRGAGRGGRRRARPRAEAPFDVGGKGGLGVDLEDLLGELFKGGRPAGFGGGLGGMGFGGMGFEDMEGFAGASRAAAGADVTASITVTLEEVARGGQRELVLRRPMPCEPCEGSGRAAPEGGGRCRGCGGSGRVQVAQGGTEVSTRCGRCGGTGRLPAPPCAECEGSGVQEREARLRVQIPAGVESGQQIRLRGQGAPGAGGGPPGDLLLGVTVEKHARFRRDGLDLEVDVPVTLSEALFGAELELGTLDGRVKLKIPPGSQSGARLRLRGRGLAAKGATGDLYARLMVKLPPVPPDAEELRQAVARLEALYPGPVRRD
jgi:molecular chaperone DnaJ